MEDQITPGPWRAYKRNNPIGLADYEVHFGEDGECIAEVVHVGADAKLISASPDLLEALEISLDVMTSKKTTLEDQADAITLARRSINKAYGET
jgi:hypothetical protein